MPITAFAARLKNIHVPGNNQKGIALMLVLWIITFLAVICAEFSLTMRTELTTVANFKDGEQAYYTAEAGVNRAMIELMKSAGRPDRIEEDIAEPEQLYWEPGGSYRIELEENFCEVLIEDEGNKMEINSFLTQAEKNPASIKSFLKKNLGLEGEELDTVADSLIDWHDKDNNITGVSGAEEDYYKKLDPSYGCRNGDIPVLEELMLVKGVDENIFYGRARAGEQEQKIKLTREELDQIMAGAQPAEEEQVAIGEDETDNATKKALGLTDIFFAAYPELLWAAGYKEKAGLKIDINTANVNQLLFLDGMNMATAQKIISQRAEKRYASETDPRLMGLRNHEVWKSQIIVSKKTSRQGLFKITATGYSPDGRVSRSIACTMILQKKGCSIISWRATN